MSKFDKLTEAYMNVIKENAPDKLSSVSQTIKDVAAAYDFDITFYEDKTIVKSKDEQFYWDSSYDMHNFWVTLKHYFVDTSPYR
jgi:hypothetical protein